MTQPNAKELNKILKPFTDRHISPSEKETLKAKVGDRERVAKDWNDMMAEWQTLMQAGDPTSPAAQDLARRWIAFSVQFRAIDMDLKSKEKAIMADAMNDPATAEKLATYRQIAAFADQAVAHLG